MLNRQWTAPPLIKRWFIMRLEGSEEFNLVSVLNGRGLTGSSESTENIKLWPSASPLGLSWNPSKFKKIWILDKKNPNGKLTWLGHICSKGNEHVGLFVWFCMNESGCWSCIAPFNPGFVPFVGLSAPPDPPESDDVVFGDRQNFFRRDTDSRLFSCFCKKITQIKKMKF
jgi:hypothetical protein